MTQLLIAGVEVVLPQNFACTVKRENSFFTKSGEYTYDATLNLDNPTNRGLYGFLQRINKKEQVDTKRSAVLIADGHVYCRGTEVITRWTNESVTIQIVSGESELNYFMGQDQKIEDLDLGRITVASTTTVMREAGVYPAADYCDAVIRTAAGQILNHPLGGQRAAWPWAAVNDRPQPYLCAIIRKIMAALGYTVGTNQLEDTQFKYLFLVNTIMTTEYAKMIPGWTVKDFLSEVEKLTGVVFITNNLTKTCDIILKTVYYQEATQFTLRNVIDAYEAELDNDDSRQEEFTTSDVSYDLPDNYWAKLMKLPEGFLESAEVVDYSDLATLMASTFNTEVVKHDQSTDRYYIDVTREYEVIQDAQTTTTETDSFTVEIDQFQNLDREDTTSTLELKMTPAPMAQLGMGNCEIIALGSGNGYKDFISDAAASDNSSSEDNGDAGVAESVIQSFDKKESAAADLYCAFNNGSTTTYSRSRQMPLVYTDAYHALLQGWLYPMATVTGNTFEGPEGSLRLQDLEDSYYQGGYQIDTAHPMTFETYDPNVIDVRQVYVIRNKRFVVRDVEEVITATGRQKKWKLTCYPITITDTALENRWVLTDGVWDDGGAWLDDGRWLDN